MDSLTQILLGASTAAAVVPSAHRRRALAAGALLGTLPDLDVLPLALLGLDPVQSMTWHRGPSHGLLVLAALGLLLWWWLRHACTPVREAPRPWLAAILLALITHPLLDAFTVYGTQLAWPWPSAPAMWSSVFIIDPLYTLPLLAGVCVALCVGANPRGGRALRAGLLLSTAYLGWSLAAKAWVESDVERSLEPLALADAPRFSVPSPFNTLLWRVVVMTPDGFLEADRSLLADRGPLLFRHHASDTAALQAAATLPAVQRLHWFNRGFMKADVHDSRLVLSDLRMGAEPDYSFRFAVAARDGDAWAAVTPERLRGPSIEPRQLTALWERIIEQPARERALLAQGVRVLRADDDAQAAARSSAASASAAK